MADFAFATCLPGMEPALKREVARTRPELRFAYSRPGLVTFKAESGEVTADDAPGSVFARVWGRSIGPARDPATASQLVPVGTQRVHVFPRDPEAAPDVSAWQTLGEGGPALEGELVMDVIVAPDEP